MTTHTEATRTVDPAAELVRDLIASMSGWYATRGYAERIVAEVEVVPVQPPSADEILDADLKAEIDHEIAVANHLWGDERPCDTEGV